MNTSSSRNPKELVDRYLQAVRFWAPKPQEDLIAELGEDLRSQIEAKEADLGRPLDQGEVSAILKACGMPMVVASRLGPKRYLIGPALYPIYKFVLKMVLLWILVPVFLFIVGPTNVVNSKGDWGLAVLNTFGNLWTGLFVAAGVITLVFAILERTSAHAAIECKWDPLTLPPLQKQERKPSLIKTVCELGFGVFGLIWLLLVPHYPVLILGPAASFLKAGSLWHTFYVPVLLLGVFGLLRSGMILARPQWTWLPTLSQLLQTALTLVVLSFMIQAVGQPSHGTWAPFVALADTAKQSAEYIKVAAIVNASILLSLAGTWLGLCIAGVIQTWEFMRYVRKRRSSAPQTASLPAQ